MATLWLAGGEDQTASKSHRQAEKRRRERINAQFNALRKHIPMSDKMDKAGLLGQAVDQVREQSKIANELSRSCTVPTEMDQVTIEQEERGSSIRVSICCNDRPDLFADINNAIKSLGLTIGGAEITCIGGRTSTSFLLQSQNQNLSLKQSLKSALNRVVLSSGSADYIARSKRQRFFYPPY